MSHAAAASSYRFCIQVALATPSLCSVAIAAGDAMWQRAGLSVGCLVNALRAHRDALAASGRVATAIDSATAWAWQTETPPPAGSALAVLRHYAVELLAAFRCVAMGDNSAVAIWISHVYQAAHVVRICRLVNLCYESPVGMIRLPASYRLHGLSASKLCLSCILRLLNFVLGLTARAETRKMCSSGWRTHPTNTAGIGL